MSTATITTADTTSAIALAHGLRQALAPAGVDRDRDGEQAAGLAQLSDAGALLVAPALVEAAEVTRIVASVDPGLAHVLAGHYLTQFAVTLVGGEERRELVRREAGDGRRFSWIGAPGRTAVAASLTQDRPGDLTENRPGALTRHRTGGSWSLTAGPAWAAAVDADGWLAVVAQLDGDAARREGGSAIALIPSGAQGVTRTEVRDRPFGLRTVAHERVALQAATVPDDRVLRLALDRPADPTLVDAIAQLLDAAVELGIGRAAIERAADYVRTRTRAAFEADQERAADEPHLIRRAGDLVVPLYAAETLLEQAARALDERVGSPVGEPVASAVGERAASAPATKRLRSAAGDAALLQVAELRVVARDAAIALTSQSLELAGASASDSRHGLDRFWRDAQSVFVLGSVAWGASVLGARTIAFAGRRQAGAYAAAKPAEATVAG
jgi:alkylation response protein AidB-like acyl-CoA dehydrogenase